ncbi:hypothetical protein ROD_29401 [Citrobacter rodentium ICC168]|uniref:Uncharacterized protein n=1 Tax=Citrobacter rodentium (strain ICC168) TaxID=637910 RepID=D2TJN9_CITRI|nr:hypothetical protein ROD_29401 [Citrobacter rodentium ICC168]
MEMPSSTSNSLYINDILYSEEDRKVILYFSCIDNKEIFSAEVKKVGEIKLVSSDELYSFLMKFMPYEPSIFNKLHKIIWDYIEGREVIFPIQLVP